jgi:hypothetical protein
MTGIEKPFQTFSRFGNPPVTEKTSVNSFRMVISVLADKTGLDI